MKSAALFYVAILAVAAFITITIHQQLSTDASPAAAFCSMAERQGVACQVADKYDSQVVVVDDGVSKSGYLIVSSGKEIIAVIPLK